MLNLKHRYRMQLPSFRAAHLQLSTVVADNDELTQAIENDAETRDDNWTLDATPDTRELNQFWTNVEEDISHDPTWQRFDDE